MDINAYAVNPGTGTLVQTSEAVIWTGRETQNEYGNMQVISSATDSGSTPTTFLRPGLILGRITASGLLTAYSPTATDGSEIAYCVLATGQSTLDYTGTAVQKGMHVLLKGILQAANLNLLDNMARRALVASGRYIFDDALHSKLASGGLPLAEVSKAADYQVLVTDIGRLLTATAAVVFTLPAIAAGLGPFEFLNLADSAMTVASTEGDNIVADNDASADSLAFSTASHKIGGHIQVWANSAGTKWYWRNLSQATCTITVST